MTKIDLIKVKAIENIEIQQNIIRDIYGKIIKSKQIDYKITLYCHNLFLSNLVLYENYTLTLNTLFLYHASISEIKINHNLEIIYLSNEKNEKLDYEFNVFNNVSTISIKSEIINNTYIIYKPIFKCTLINMYFKENIQILEFETMNV